MILIPLWQKKMQMLLPGACTLEADIFKSSQPLFEGNFTITP